MWQGAEHIAAYVLELLVLVAELVALIFIVRELRELRRHTTALARHESELRKARPLLSTLYTDGDDILELAVAFTRDARQIRALGTITALAETELRPGEREAEWQGRFESVSALRKQYVAATGAFIDSGKPYYRVMNFSPGARADRASVWELWANVRFFLRAMEANAGSATCLHLIHDPDLVRGGEDFHYRVSDSAVVIRVGGPARADSNAAILIRDERVVATFEAAHDAMVSRPRCREIHLDLLRSIESCLSKRDLEALRGLLEEAEE